MINLPVRGQPMGTQTPGAGSDTTPRELLLEVRQLALSVRALTTPVLSLTNLGREHPLDPADLGKSQEPEEGFGARILPALSGKKGRPLVCAVFCVAIPADGLLRDPSAPKPNDGGRVRCWRGQY